MKSRLNIHLYLDELPVDLSIKLAHALNAGCQRLAEEDAFSSDGFPLQVYGIDHSGHVFLNPRFETDHGRVWLTGEVANVELMPDSSDSCCDLYLNNRPLTEAEKEDLEEFAHLPWPALTIRACALFRNADLAFFDSRCDPERIRIIPDSISCSQMHYLIDTQIMFRCLEECIWLVNYWNNRKEVLV